MLDEPAEGLDLKGRQLVQQVIQQQRERGRTVLLVTHILPDVGATCDRLGVLVEGRLAHVGTVAEFTASENGGAPRPIEQALARFYEVDLTGNSGLPKSLM